VITLDNTDKIDNFDKGLMIFISISTIILMFTSLYIQWTAVAEKYIDGVQGRYFIPLMLPLTIICNIKNINTGKISEKLLFWIVNIVILVNIYTLMVIFFNHIGF
jgi:uncharacterized membrane protein